MRKLRHHLFRTGASLLVVGLFSVAIIKPVFAQEEEKIIRFQPFVANYLAAMIAEYRDETKQAAGYYEKAEQALGGDIGLQEKTFSLHMANGNIDKAYKVAKKLLDIEGTSPLSKLLVAVYDVDKGDYKLALEKISALHKDLPSVLQFHLAQSYLDIELGKSVKKVVKDLKKADYSDLLDGHRYYHIGRMYEKAGQTDKAVKAFEKAFDEDTGSIFNVLELGRLYEQTQRRDMARDVYRIFQESNPESMLLKSTFRRFKSGKAIKKYVKPTIEDDLAEVLFGFSTLMVSQNLDTAGRQLLHMTTKISDKHAFAHFYEGVLNEQNDELEDAIKSYGFVAKDNPAWLSSQVRVARVLKKIGKKDAAIRKLNALLKDNPDEVFLHKTAAEIYYESKQYKKAAKHYSRVLSGNKSMSEAKKSVYYFARGASYERLGNFEKASADLEKSLESNPNNPTVMNYLGYMWIDTGNKIDEAFAHIQKALLLRPNDGSIIDSMGWAYFKKADYESAAQLLERAVELLPDDATINMHLGDTYEKLGRFDEAKLQWQRALELGPDTEKHKKHLKIKLRIRKTAKK
jgi:tetratricopeptide (TPR) repeat protein